MTKHPNRVVRVGRIVEQETGNGISVFALAMSETKDVKLRVKAEAMEELGMSDPGAEFRLIFQPLSIKLPKSGKSLHPSRAVSVWKIQTDRTLDGITIFSLARSESEDVTLTINGDAMSELGMASYGSECRIVFRTISTQLPREDG